MKIKFSFDGPGIIAQMREIQRPVAEAAFAALDDAAKTSVVEGRQNISRAGRFGSRWVTGLKYRLTPEKPSLRARATIFHTVGLAGQFQTGTTIMGKPLLWLPIRANLPPRVNSPKQYGRKLVSVNRPGKKPMLFAALRGPDRKPLFVGAKSIKIPKKFSVIEIVERQAGRLGEFFLRHFKGN